jgi:alcohol dehydrogenase class IV
MPPSRATATPAGFALPTKVITGLGSLASLPAEVARFGDRRIAVVADRGVADSGLLDRIIGGVSPARIAARILIEPDPDVAAAEHAAATARGARCGLVLAIGGGSALGAAKAVALRLTNDERIQDMEGREEVATAPAPTIAIPTTAGSGSEVSKVLVLHEPGRATELIVRVDGEEPRVAILDATVLRELPRTPMLYAGLDALSHCLDSLWSRRASFFSRALARQAAASIIELLPDAVNGAVNGANRGRGNDAVLQGLLEASCAANMACGNSGLALVHALSGCPEVHLPHGQQNGILLPHVAAFNDPASDDETRRLAAQLPGLYGRLGFQAAFPAETIAPHAGRSMIAASGGHQFRANNVRESSDQDVAALLSMAGVGVHP